MNQAKNADQNELGFFEKIYFCKKSNIFRKTCFWARIWWFEGLGVSKSNSASYFTPGPMFWRSGELWRVVLKPYLIHTILIDYPSGGKNPWFLYLFCIFAYFPKNTETLYIQSFFITPPGAKILDVCKKLCVFQVFQKILKLYT